MSMDRRKQLLREAVAHQTGTLAAGHPVLTNKQVADLEVIYPVRLPNLHEDMEAYREYCGAARLVQTLKSIAKGEEPGDSDTTEEILEVEAVGRAIAQHHGVPYEED